MTGFSCTVFVMLALSLQTGVEGLRLNRDVGRSLAYRSSTQEVVQWNSLQDLILDLKSPYQHVRADAAVLLGESGSAEAVPALIAALQDTYYLVRTASAGALGHIGNAEAVPALIDAMQPDKDFNLRQTSIDALGKIGSAEAVPALIAIMQNDAGYLRKIAARALGEIGNKEAVPALIAALQEHAISYAAMALGKIGSAEALPALIAAMQLDDEYMRKTAATALGEIGNKEAVPALMAVFQDPRWRVVTASPVRKDKSSRSEEIGHKAPGTIVRGVAEGWWLRLLGEPGYCLISDPKGWGTIWLKDDAKEARRAAKEALLKIMGNSGEHGAHVEMMDR